MDASDTARLVDRWVRAWTHVRALPVSTVDGFPLVQVRSVTRETELVCADPGPEVFASLMTHVARRPQAMLTVIAPDLAGYHALPLPPDVRVDRDDETLMTAVLAPTELGPPPPGLTERWTVDGAVVRYALESGRSVAAEGTVGVLGEDAVYDAVETMPAYRRRGLGRQVMSALSGRAVQLGARHGILAASSQGRGLYESLDWRADLPMWSLMGAEHRPVP